MRIDALDGLTIDYSLQTKHTVGRGVLRTNVDYIFVVIEKAALFSHEVSILVEMINSGVVGLFVILKRIRVIEFPVFTERISIEIVAQIEAAHVRMLQELDAIEVEDLTLKQVGHIPKMCHCGNHEILFPHPFGNHFHAGALMSVGILKNIYTSQSFFCTEILADNGYEIVKMLLVLEVRHFSGKAVKIKN